MVCEFLSSLNECGCPCMLLGPLVTPLLLWHSASRHCHCAILRWKLGSPRPIRAQEQKFSHYVRPCRYIARDRGWQPMDLGRHVCRTKLPPRIQRKTKGQQLKGKIVSALFHTFPHFSHFFRIFLPGLLLKLWLFLENMKEKTKPFCTLVVARLSSSKECFHSI